jgi:lambda family phage portal protein
MAAERTWLDRAIGSVSPGWELRRLRARLLTDVARRHYEGASSGRRTQHWNRASTDPNAALQNNYALSRLRDIARDLVRNNPYAESAATTIADHAVGAGIVAKPRPVHPRAGELWRAWAETTACDADGRHDFYGLQHLVMETVAVSGEVIVRRRQRRVEDGLPLPVQVQVLEPDYLDAGKTTTLPNGGYIIQGVEFNGWGQRVAYWLFPSHPGSSLGGSTLLSGSRPVPASEVLHVFKGKRPGQVRAPSWFGPIVLRLKDFDEYEDATIMKQKVAACLSVLTTDVDGSSPALGTADDTTNTDEPTDTLSPGAVLNLPAGRTVTVVDPPRVGDYGSFTSVSLRAIAAGLNVTYEDLTGDYTNLPFSAARMSRLRHYARVEDWRWRMLVPQFCDPVWGWAMEAAAINGLQNPPGARWTPPPLPFIDPSQEGLAVQRNVRSGITSLPEAIRERGYDPDELLDEIAAFNKKLDDLGIVLDTDPRKMSQAGQQQSADNGGAQ